MTPEVLVAIVTTLGLIVVTVLTNRTRQHAKATRTQVENNHVDAEGKPINLREESDERHAENSSMLAQLLKIVTGMQGDIRGMRRDIGRLADADAKHDERIHDLEQTTPRPPRGGKRT